MPMHYTTQLRDILTSLGRVGDPSPGYSTAAVARHRAEQ